METKILNNEKIIACENTDRELTEKDLEEVSGGYIAYSTSFGTWNAGRVTVANPFSVTTVAWSNWNRISSSGIYF